MDKEIPDILTLANKEKFRRKLLISSRLIGVLLILSIFWIGFVQIKYVAEINSIKAEYGDNAYCYLCGLEAHRTCGCTIISDMEYRDNSNNWDEYFEEVALKNIADCPDFKDLNPNKFDVNSSNIKINN